MTTKATDIILKKLVSFDSPASKVFNKIRLKYLDADTSTSYISKREAWTWGDSSSSYKVGVRQWEGEIEWIQVTATAQNIVDDLYSEHYQEKQEITIKTKFIPQVEPFNKVTLTYITPRKEGRNLWGKFLWGKENWNAATGRYINIDNKNFLVLKVTHNFDTMESEFMMRETDAYIPGYGTSYYSRLYYNQ